VQIKPNKENHSRKQPDITPYGQSEETADFAPEPSEREVNVQLLFLSHCHELEWCSGQDSNLFLFRSVIFWELLNITHVLLYVMMVILCLNL
jgi:hypothetical protein